MECQSLGLFCQPLSILQMGKEAGAEDRVCPGPASQRALPLCRLSIIKAQLKSHPLQKPSLTNNDETTLCPNILYTLVSFATFCQYLLSAPPSPAAHCLPDTLLVTTVAERDQAPALVLCTV